MARLGTDRPHLEELPSSLSFGELMGRVLTDLRPMKAMWPYFWLKTLAVRDGERWRLCYYGLSGRWSAALPPGAFEVDEEQQTIIVVSRLIDAATAWKQMKSLAEGRLQLAPRSIAYVPSLSFNGSTFQQTTLPPWANLKIVTNVAEPNALWRFLFVFGQASFQAPGTPTNAPQEEQVSKALQTALHFYNMPALHELLCGFFGGDSRGGKRYEVRDFHAALDFPLAVVVERELPDLPSHQQRIRIACLPPLKPNTLQVQAGPIFRSRGPHLSITPAIEGTGPGQWSDGAMLLPNVPQKLWIYAPPFLRKVLSVPLELPTPEAQIAQALWQLYHPTKSEEGERRWRKALLDGDGPDFEVALMNTLARFGIPVVFAGDIAEERDGVLVHGGPQVEGYDLIVTGYATKRIVLISVKGSESAKQEGYTPKDEDGAKLLKGVEAFQQHLPPTWEVMGLLVCQAPQRRLHKWAAVKEFTVWGKEDLETLLQTDSCKRVETWLGLRPVAAPMFPVPSLQGEEE
ncbi:MAG TPA: hypothetical protein VKT82_07540 [Ktedonobacterales bacterium]|nr:hypothetical protein [Ktedonobacterales bacterium]